MASVYKNSGNDHLRGFKQKQVFFLHVLAIVFEDMKILGGLTLFFQNRNLTFSLLFYFILVHSIFTRPKSRGAHLPDYNTAEMEERVLSQIFSPSLVRKEGNI